MSSSLEITTKSCTTDQPLKQVDPPSSKSDSAVQGIFFNKVTPSDDPVLLIENLVLQTGFMRSCRKPISLLLLGKPGIGKSRLLSPFLKVKEASYVNDITPKYLVEFLGQVKRQEKKFLVIPDFTNCTSHGKSTSTTLIAILRNMTEEGIVDLSDYHLEFKSDTPVRAGLITATTNSNYNEFKRQWKNTGFLSRLLPFSFTHSIPTTRKIMDAIDAGTPDSIEKICFTINRKPKRVNCPDIMLRQLRAYEETLSRSNGALPYRSQIQLRSITEALAVIRQHSKITQDDIDTIAELSKWINYDFKEL